MEVALAADFIDIEKARCF